VVFGTVVPNENAGFGMAVVVVVEEVVVVVGGVVLVPKENVGAGIGAGIGARAVLGAKLSAANFFSVVSQEE
jgi:hypothetical protein